MVNICRWNTKGSFVPHVQYVQYKCASEDLYNNTSIQLMFSDIDLLSKV